MDDYKSQISISIRGDDNGEKPVANRIVTGIVTKALRAEGFTNIKVNEERGLNMVEPIQHDTPEAYLKSKASDVPTMLDMVRQSRPDLLDIPITLDIMDGESFREFGKILEQRQAEREAYIAAHPPRPLTATERKEAEKQIEDAAVQVAVMLATEMKKDLL